MSNLERLVREATKEAKVVVVVAPTVEDVVVTRQLQQQQEQESQPSKLPELYDFALERGVLVGVAGRAKLPQGWTYDRAAPVVRAPNGE